MKGFLHHLIAAITGFVLAGLMVFFVFGAADEQGAAQDGTAPSISGAAIDRDRSGCGAIPASEAGSRDALEAALADPPAILDAEGREVRITDEGQSRWIARLQAAASRCIDELALRPNTGPDTLALAVTFPQDMGDEAISAHLMELLGVAFAREPFVIQVVTMDVGTASGTRSLLVNRLVWQTFRDQRSGLDLPDTIDGLIAIGDRISYNRNELDASGW